MIIHEREKLLYRLYSICSQPVQTRGESPAPLVFKPPPAPSNPTEAQTSPISKRKSYICLSSNAQDDIYRYRTEYRFEKEVDSDEEWQNLDSLEDSLFDSSELSLRGSSEATTISLRTSGYTTDLHLSTNLRSSGYTSELESSKPLHTSGYTAELGDSSAPHSDLYPTTDVGELESLENSLPLPSPPQLDVSMDLEGGEKPNNFLYLDNLSAEQLRFAEVGATSTAPKTARGLGDFNGRFQNLTERIHLFDSVNDPPKGKVEVNRELIHLYQGCSVLTG